MGCSGRDDRTIPDVAAALALMYATDPTTPYLSFQARTGAAVADIDAAFYEERTLLHHTTVRRTVFAMPLGTTRVKWRYTTPRNNRLALG